MFTTFLQLNFLEEIVIIKRTFTILLVCVFVAIPFNTICNKTTRKNYKDDYKDIIIPADSFSKIPHPSIIVENPFRVTIVEGSVISFTRTDA